MGGFIALATRGLEAAVPKIGEAGSLAAKSLEESTLFRQSLIKDATLQDAASSAGKDVSEVKTGAEDAPSDFARSFYSARSSLSQSDSFVSRVSRLRDSEMEGIDEGGSVSKFSKSDISRAFYNKDVFQSRIANAFSRGGGEVKSLDGYVASRGLNGGDGEVKSLDGYGASRGGLGEGDGEELSSPTSVADRQQANSFQKWYDSLPYASKSADIVESPVPRPIEIDTEEMGDISKGVVDAKASKVPSDNDFLYSSSEKGVGPKAADYNRPITGEEDELSVVSEDLGAGDANSDASNVSSVSKADSVFSREVKTKDAVDATPDTLKTATNAGKDTNAAEDTNAVKDNRTWFEKFMSGPWGFGLNMTMMGAPAIAQGIVGEKQYKAQMAYQEQQEKFSLAMQLQQAEVEGISSMDRIGV